MTESQIRFDDGAGYERMMGTWSRLVGLVFLDWLAPASGLSWIDVGCGNGAFTELLIDRCAPSAVQGVDPSDGQLSYARTRPSARLAKYTQGDAAALPFPAASFDAAVMALVIFFVPDPRKGTSEMVRVVRPGGPISAYAWDLVGGGFPLEPFQAELRAMGYKPMLPPSPDASRIDAMRDLWSGAGLQDVETRSITVERTFANFDDLWSASMLGSTMRPMLAKLTPGDVDHLMEHARKTLPPDASGRITYSARANAVKGRVPK